MPSTWVRTRIGRPPGKSFDEGEVGEGSVVYRKDGGVVRVGNAKKTTWPIVAVVVVVNVVVRVAPQSVGSG